MFKVEKNFIFLVFMSHSAHFRNEIRFIALIFHFCAHQMRMMYAFSIQERTLNAHRIEKSSMNV